MKNSPLVQEFRPSWTNGLFCIDFFLIFTTSASISAMLTGSIVSQAFHEEIHAIMDVILPRYFNLHFFEQKKGTPNNKNTPLVRKVPNFDSES